MIKTLGIQLHKYCINIWQGEDNLKADLSEIEHPCFLTPKPMPCSTRLNKSSIINNKQHNSCKHIPQHKVKVHNSLRMWRGNQDEPVILTLSSDEDEEGNPSNQNEYLQALNQDLSFKLKDQTVLQEPINPKEPTILPNCSYENNRLFHKNFPGLSYEDQITNNKNDVNVLLQCRSLRIGSYKVIPVDRVDISFEGIKMIVPPFVEGEENHLRLHFPLKGIVKILAHFGYSFPALFLYITDPVATAIRSQLQMGDNNGFYFDPCSQEESQKRVTLLPEKLKSETVNILRNLLNFEIQDLSNGETRLLLEELSQKDANEILVRSSPVEIESLLLNSKATITYETRTLLVFPPPPNKGGISISMDDYCCLKDEQFLNDVLVDFYLKWLHMCHLSEVDRERTHVFSTFFYKRLTSKPKNTRRSHSTEDNPNLSSAQKRHARVKSWTKNVDIFTKDFILIPINEHSHWFLAVICFPGLEGAVRMSDGKPILRPEVVDLPRVSGRTRKKIEIPIIDDGEWSDRDEAEGDDNELEDPEDSPDASSEPPRKRLREREDAGVKQPCILILDSFSGASRSRIVATLRDYLSVEHQQRKGAAKAFTKDTMKGCCPKVPQQNNYSDCGLFTLQFAQSFFESPLKDFQWPINSLRDWFGQDVVAKKREAIGNLIKSLMDEHKPNHGINLPPIHSSAGKEEETTSGDDDNKDKDTDNSENKQENSGTKMDENSDTKNNKNLDTKNVENSETKTVENTVSKNSEVPENPEAESPDSKISVNPESENSENSQSKKHENSPSKKQKKSESKKHEKSQSKKHEKSQSKKHEKSQSKKHEKSPSKKQEKSQSKKLGSSDSPQKNSLKIDDVEPPSMSDQPPSSSSDADASSPQPSSIPVDPETENFRSCSGTIKYLSNLLDSRANSQVNSSKDPDKANSISNESSCSIKGKKRENSGVERDNFKSKRSENENGNLNFTSEIAKKITKKVFSPKPNCTSVEKEKTKVNSSLQLLCDSYQGDNSDEEDQIFVNSSKKTSLSTELNNKGTIGPQGSPHNKLRR